MIISIFINLFRKSKLFIINLTLINQHKCFFFNQIQRRSHYFLYNDLLLDKSNVLLLHKSNVLLLVK